MNSNTFSSRGVIHINNVVFFSLNKKRRCIVMIHWKRSIKVIVLVGLVNALFSYCFWSLTNRVTELEQTSQETLILTEKIMEEMSK